MATKIKLMRLGKMRAPYYRVVVADARTKRDGRAIETIGKYHPKEDPSFIQIDSERAQHWLSVGAQPTEAVAALLKVTGDWQRFKGLPAPPPMLVAAPKADKRVAYEQAARAALGDSAGEAAARGARRPAAGSSAGPAAAAPAAPAAPAPSASSPAPPSETGAAGDAAPSGGQ